MPMSEQTEKPRLNSREVEALTIMHEGNRIPAKLRSAMMQLLGKEFICAGERGWCLTLKGKQIARHLTAKV